jgi:hypothetical protein
VGLLRFIVEGFGWEVGRTAAKEALDAARGGEPDEPTTEKARAEAAKAAQRAAAENAKRREREAKERAKEARRRERELDRELAALKKRIRD